MKTFAMRFLGVGTLSIFALSAAMAQVTLGAVADADAVGGPKADDNQGSRPWIMENWDTGVDITGHIQFDVSGFGAGTVTSATLRLFHDFNGQNGVTYNVHRVVDAWDEGTLTYNNRPDLAVATSASLTIADFSTGVWREFDVTALVQAWVDGAEANNGMALKRDPNSSPWCYFRSKENLDGNNPELVVNVVPEPASMAALGLGAAALLRRRRK